MRVLIWNFHRKRRRKILNAEKKEFIDAQDQRIEENSQEQGSNSQENQQQNETDMKDDVMIDTITNQGMILNLFFRF